MYLHVSDIAVGYDEKDVVGVSVMRARSVSICTFVPVKQVNCVPLALPSHHRNVRDSRREVGGAVQRHLAARNQGVSVY